MRKLFRFKYEPCNGTCYAYCDRLIAELRKLADPRILVSHMVAAHNKLCDNPDYSFGVDVDEKENVFVAHFRTPEKTDLYSGRSFEDVVNEVCHAVTGAEIPQASGQCNFGSNGAEDLGREILEMCTDEAYGRLQERHCECKAHAA